MMYANDDEFVRDFAQRTKKNYQKLQSGPYEVTQLINSSIGLLVIPKEKQYDKITDTMISNELLEKIKQCVTENSYKDELDLCEIVRHLRNSIAHARFEFKAEKPSMNGAPLEIHKVVFKDENLGTKEHFKIEFSITLLEEFFLAFADAVAKL